MPKRCWCYKNVVQAILILRHLPHMMLMTRQVAHEMSAHEMPRLRQVAPAVAYGTYMKDVDDMTGAWNFDKWDVDAEACATCDFDAVTCDSMGHMKCRWDDMRHMKCWQDDIWHMSMWYIRYLSYDTIMSETVYKNNRSPCSFTLLYNAPIATPIMKS